jgi:hypothetical protein
MERRRAEAGIRRHRPVPGDVAEPAVLRLGEAQAPRRPDGRRERDHRRAVAPRGRQVAVQGRAPRTAAHPAGREAERDLHRVRVRVRGERVGGHEVAHPGGPAGVQDDGATSARGLLAQPASQRPPGAWTRRSARRPRATPRARRSARDAARDQRPGQRRRSPPPRFRGGRGPRRWSRGRHHFAARLEDAPAGLLERPHEAVPSTPCAPITSTARAAAPAAISRPRLSGGLRRTCALTRVRPGTASHVLQLNSLLPRETSSGRLVRQQPWCRPPRSRSAFSARSCPLTSRPTARPNVP